MKLSEKLANLYNDNSKHSNYQNVPDFVSRELNYTEVINEEWRGDTARFKYLLDKLKKLNISSISDIGANTGFFSLSIAHSFPNIKCNAFELNTNHTKYIETIKEHFGLENISVIQKGVIQSTILEMDYTDAMLHFNVLHHAGVDFDNEQISEIENFDTYAIDYLKKLKNVTSLMFYQIGYNWGGNKSKPLVKVGDLREMISWCEELFCKSQWKIKSIAIYNNYFRHYEDLNCKEYPNERKNNDLKGKLKSFNEILHEVGFDKNSEFYRRPLFIVESK